LVLKTGYFTHVDCALHAMGPDHPECPERLSAIHDRLLLTGVAEALQARSAPMAGTEDLALAHSSRYIAHVQGMHDDLRRSVLTGGPALAQLDPDTAMNVHTWAAALRAAGAALAATDAVLEGALRNAFCAVRPPGHHAGRHQGAGFCFFNNVVVAARHALERHGLKRVAIVDFDVHHGNGTEDIIQGDQRILMLGFYQHPLYPDGGARSNASNLLNVPVPAYTGGEAIRELVSQHWLPRLHAYQPEMVFISAGFDAHRSDTLGQLGLVEEDYAWMTREICAAADRYAQGRIVSCLEGGYHPDALAHSVEAHLRVLTGMS
jgi:acetoin utilization deacetylase AcuC-like enzyme